MPLKIKKSLNYNDGVFQALRHRVTDEAHTSLSKREIDIKVKEYLANNIRQNKLELISGHPIYSSTWNEYLKDQKLFIESLNRRITSLENEIRNSSKQKFNLLHNLYQEVLSLDAWISEEELKTYNNIDYVHYNAFIRSKDLARQSVPKQAAIDFKTGFSFTDEYKASVIKNFGLLLPILKEVPLKIKQIHVVHELTDVGDTTAPLVSSDPNNLLVQDRIFQHTIVRKRQDNTTRKYPKKRPTLGLLIEFATPQLLNKVTLSTTSANSLKVTNISFLNSSSEEIDLLSLQIATDNKTTLIFEPVFTQYLTLVLEQPTPQAYTSLLVEDQLRKEINQVLEQAGFSQLLEENAEEVTGQIYDFSLESIETSLLVFNHTGAFFSQPQLITDLASLSVTDKVLQIPITSRREEYQQDSTLGEGTVLNEYYAYIKAKDADNTLLIDEVIPLVDTPGVQREFLPLVGDVARLKFIPDFDWNYPKYIIDSVVLESSSGLVNNYRIHLNNPVDLTPGSIYTFICKSNSEHPLNGVFDLEVIDSNTLQLSLFNDSRDFALSEGSRPVSYLYRDERASEPPLRVFSDKREYVLGQDYLISLDGGNTFLEEIPIANSYRQLLQNSIAGDAFIKIINKSSASYYWIEYKPKNKQHITHTRLARLVNDSILFSKRIKEANVMLLAVSRSDNSNMYITHVIQHYILKANQHVS